MDPEREKYMKELFFNDFQAFKEEANKEKDANLAVLYLYLNFMEDIKKLHLDAGVEESVFLDGMRDLKIWADDHFDKTGEHGLTQWGWVRNIMRMKVMRLGRLEFEPTEMPVDFEANGKKISKGEPALGVHIPAGEKLDEKAVYESFIRAQGFFKSHFGKDYKAYICGSWLLSPELEKLLPPESLILRFQKNFTLYDCHPSRQAEERVFLKISDDYSVYPENTRLQKNLKNFLLSGGNVRNGSGAGFFADVKNPE